MLETLLTLVVIELLGAAALPLVALALPRLADRGYGLAKVLGLLLTTYVNYLLGSALGLGNSAVVLALAMLLLFLGGAVAVRAERADLLRWFADCRRLVLVEEGLFLLLFLLWTAVRAAHPAVLSTEKPMDLAMMTAAHRATVFPPYDPWLAGTSINYYYGGYLAIGTLVTLTGVAAPVGYNLGLAVLFALVGLGAYSVAYSLTRRLSWALLGPIFVVLVGNLDGVRQLVDPTHGITAFNFFQSSRVLENGNAITEFPAFSFLLGDLHPHVIALPFTILVIGIALHMAQAPSAGWHGLARGNPRRVATVVLSALAVGALYFMNSWDWPTYMLLIGAALLLPCLVKMDRRRFFEALALAVGIFMLSYLLFLSFHRDFQPQYGSFGFHAHGSPTDQVFVMFGLFLVPAAVLIVMMVNRKDELPSDRSSSARARSWIPSEPPVVAASAASVAATQSPLAREAADDIPRLPMPGIPRLGGQNGRALAIPAAAVVLWLLLQAVAGLGTVGLLLPFLCAALFLAWREGSAGHSLPAFALLLCAGGIGLIILCDFAFLKDNFCGPDASGTCTGALYRMNTVFKFYYQAWTLLALGAAFGLYKLAESLRSGWRRFIGPGGAAVITLAGVTYLLLGLFTTTTNPYTIPVAAAPATLDGASYLRAYTGPPSAIMSAVPDDAAAIQWLSLVSGHPTILEADQVTNGGSTGPQDYWPYPGASNQELLMARVSTFTGLPAVLGWGYSHEGLWHGDAVVSHRFTDVQTLYTSASSAVVGRLLRTYGVGYIYVGRIEAYTYYHDDPSLEQAAIHRFERFARVVYNARGVTILRTRDMGV